MFSVLFLTFRYTVSIFPGQEMCYVYAYMSTHMGACVYTHIHVEAREQPQVSSFGCCPPF